jgi:uncharacterized membrane protein YbhN (UPF0104 family)
MTIPHAMGIQGSRPKWLNWLVTLASVGIIATAAFVLCRMLVDLDVDRVMSAVRGTSWMQIASALALVATIYAILTLYDFLALPTLGYGMVRYRTSALAGFTSYPIGHNVGATTLVASAVRYGIYAPRLDAMAVAKVCIVAGLTFWLGNAAMLGLGMILHPRLQR